MFSADNVELSLNQGSKPKAHSKNLSTRSDIAIDKFEDAFENEIIDEGTALHHCVGGYVKRYADGWTILCALRRIDAGSQAEPEIHTSASGS